MANIHIELNSGERSSVRVSLLKSAEPKPAQIGRRIQLPTGLSFPSLDLLRGFITSEFETLRYAMSGGVEDTDALPLQKIAALRWQLLEEGAPVGIINSGVNSTISNPPHGRWDANQKRAFAGFVTGLFVSENEMSNAA